MDLEAAIIDTQNCMRSPKFITLNCKSLPDTGKETHCKRQGHAGQEELPLYIHSIIFFTGLRTCGPTHNTQLTVSDFQCTRNIVRPSPLICFQNLLIILKGNSVPMTSSLPPAPGNHWSTLSLRTPLFWSFHTHGIIPYVALCVRLYSFGVVFPRFIMVYLVSGLYSFLLGDTLLHGYSTLCLSIIR